MSAPKVYDINEGVVVTLTFKDRNGALRDPLVGTLLIVAPSGARTELSTGALTHASVGVFRHDLRFTEAGTWNVRAMCDDLIAAVVTEKSYQVRKQRF